MTVIRKSSMLTTVVDFSTLMLQVFIPELLASGSPFTGNVIDAAKQVKLGFDKSTLIVLGIITCSLVKIMEKMLEYMELKVNESIFCHFFFFSVATVPSLFQYIIRCTNF
ncbi:hypothetical protein MKX01_021547 [Papaver californicum]|nr:hypothetical protein MKX01_021547 [Papaver californicum]